MTKNACPDRPVASACRKSPNSWPPEMIGRFVNPSQNCEEPNGRGELNATFPLPTLTLNSGIAIIQGARRCCGNPVRRSQHSMLTSPE